MDKCDTLYFRWIYRNDICNYPERILRVMDIQERLQLF